MQQFDLVFAEPEGAPAALSFNAADLGAALAKVAEHHSSKPVELWSEGKLLGRLEQFSGDGESYWRLC